MDIKLKNIKIIIFILFCIIFFKFYLVTIHYNPGYTNLIEKQSNVVIETEMPRGEIYDRKGRLIVGNKEIKQLIYLGGNDLTEEKKWEIANNLNENIAIKIPDNIINQRDYQDFVIRENYYEYIETINNNPSKYEQLTTEEALEQIVTEEDYNKILKEHTQNEIDIKILIDVATPNNPKIISENLTAEEQYYILQNMDQLGGSFITSKWERYYPYGDTMKSFLGTVGDIPKEQMEYYEKLNYNTNSQVGISYIEKYQEINLRSIPQQIQIYYDDEGNINNYKIKDPGKSGYDIKLTIDIELQKKIDKILKKNLANDSYKYYKTNFSTILDVNTGEVLAMSGKYEDGKNIYDNAVGNFSTAYEIGSIVKPAVLLMGYNNNVWKYNQIVNDKPMEIGGVTKASYYDYGLVDENRAIQVSSNVYFYTMFLKLAGIEYGKEEIPSTIEKKYFDLVRKEYGELGLGIKTGLGMDEEIAGVKSQNQGSGLYADLANGQYDTYTTIQSALYMSVLANGEYKYKTNYLLSIHEPKEVGGIGKEIYKIKPKINGKLNKNSADIKHVQATLQKPSHGGTTSEAYDSRYEIGSKSGTSESFYYEEGMKESIKTNNSSFIAYAPYKNPKISIATLTPYWTQAGNVNKKSAVSIGAEILDACYEEGYI